MTGGDIAALSVAAVAAVFGVAALLAYRRAERDGVPLPRWLCPIDRAWQVIRAGAGSPVDRLLAPLYRRQARRHIACIEQDIALVQAYVPAETAAKLRETQAAWARRLHELG